MVFPVQSKKAYIRMCIFMWSVFVTLVLYIEFILLLAALSACHDGCIPNETRCKDSRVEICTEDEDWGYHADCSGTEPKDLDWQCCWDPVIGAHTCLPADICATLDGGL
jgi:hypothetical protein